jgi:hypothetical protein
LGEPSKWDTTILREYSFVYCRPFSKNLLELQSIVIMADEEYESIGGN